MDAQLVAAIDPTHLQHVPLTRLLPNAFRRYRAGAHHHALRHGVDLVDVAGRSAGGSHVNRVVGLSNQLMGVAATRGHNGLIGTIGGLTLKV